MSAALSALPTEAVQSNGEDTDDDYFAFTDSADAESLQVASDTSGVPRGCTGFMCTPKMCDCYFFWCVRNEV